MIVEVLRSRISEWAHLAVPCRGLSCILDTDLALGSLYRVDVGSIADVSVVLADPKIRICTASVV
jgi:hypothetical protein